PRIRRTDGRGAERTEVPYRFTDHRRDAKWCQNASGFSDARSQRQAWMRRVQIKRHSASVSKPTEGSIRNGGDGRGDKGKGQTGILRRNETTSNTDGNQNQATRREMTVEQPKVIDFVSTNKEGTRVFLTISDHLDWSEDDEQHH